MTLCLIKQWTRLHGVVLGEAQGQIKHGIYHRFLFCIGYTAMNQRLIMNDEM